MSDIWPRRPRDWQVKALGDWVARRQRDYLMAVCPGGGKTVAALAIARYALDQGMVKKVVVVSPTEPLTRQWCDKAAEFGISLDPDSDSKAPFNHPGQYVGVSTTYQAVARGGAQVFSRALNIHATLVILDEVHHTGEQLAWGDAVLKAFELASYRLLLSGTPKRSDTAKIAFATYGLDGDGQQRIRRDFSYGTGRGVRDFVIRRTDCRFYDAEVKEIPYGEQVAVSRSLSEALRRDDVSDLLTAVMDPSSGWLTELMGSVNKELSAIRRTVPDAGCLILADDQSKAKAYAAIVEKTTGRRPAVVISEDKDAKDTLEAFAQGTDPYLIAVRMVSEGVDIPRLRVLVYLTRTKTELFFAQATARVVRIPDARDTNPAVIFMPALPVLRELAQGIEDDVIHEIAVLEQEISAGSDELQPALAPPGPAQAIAAAPPGTYPAELPEGDGLEIISSLPVGPDGQMSLLPAAVSVDNIALQHTLHRWPTSGSENTCARNWKSSRAASPASTSTTTSPASAARSTRRPAPTPSSATTISSKMASPTRSSGWSSSRQEPPTGPAFPVAAIPRRKTGRVTEIAVHTLLPPGCWQTWAVNGSRLDGAR